MRLILGLLMLGIGSFANAEDFDDYCTKAIRGKYSSKRKKSICWCAEDNLRAQVTPDERLWLIHQALPKSKRAKREQASTPTITEPHQKRLRDVEFEVFKNCSVNYKWKANKDDIGVPDDITSP